MSSSSTSRNVVTRSVFHFFQKRFLASNVVAIHNQSDSFSSKPNSSIEKHASVINYFKSLGFSDDHIFKLAAKRPRILAADVEETLKPKIDCLVDFGFSGAFLHDLIVANPNILTRRSDSHVLPTLRLLQTYLGSDEKVAAAVKRNSWLLSYGNKETMERTLKYLVSEGVPLESISKLIALNSRILTQSVDRMVHAFKSAEQFGFRPDDPMLVYAISAILSMSESTLYQKTEFMKKLLGLSEEEVKSAFKSNPHCLKKSEEKMKNVANFFVNTVGVESSFLRYIPGYFSYSVNKRLVPRYNVYRILESKNLLRKGAKFTGQLITQGDKWFESSYIVKYLHQVPDLMKLYRGFRQTSSKQSVTATIE